MKAVITATEWRIRQALSAHAEAEQWAVPPQLLGRIAKLAAQAAGEGRPVDSPPRRAASGRKTARKAPGRPSAGRGTPSGPSESLAASTALQSPAVPRVAQESPVRVPERPSEPRSTAGGRISRPQSSQALTAPSDASGALTVRQRPDRHARVAAIARRYQAGEGIPKLARETGYSEPQLRALLQRAGVTLRQARDGAR